MKKFIQVVPHLLKFMGHLKSMNLLTLTLFLISSYCFSIGTYNFNLSKYLCELLSPNLPNEFFTKDTFTFVEELKEVNINDKFLVSCDVNSLFTSIPLNKATKLADDLIKTSYRNLKYQVIISLSSSNFQHVKYIFY